MRTEIEKAIKKTFTCFDVLAFLAKSKRIKRGKLKIIIKWKSIKESKS